MNARPLVLSTLNAPGIRLPSALLLHSGMFLTGLAMTVLGPILPLLMARWGLHDSQGGLLLTAQFAGMSIGSIAISRELNRSLMAGILAALAGFSAVALSARIDSGLPGTGFAAICSLLFLAGFGLGQLITSINLMAGQREANRGSALSFLNFSWSLGAIFSPLLVAWLSPLLSLAALIGLVSCGFLVLGLDTFREFGVSQTFSTLFGPEDTRPDRPAATSEAQSPTTGIATRLWIYFGALFFLYGGVEAAMSGWLTTFTVRYGRHGLSISETSPFLFWVSLTAGRGLATLLLLRTTESALRLASLAVATLAVGSLFFAHSLLAISICSMLVGLGIAPFFPASLSLLLVRRPRARQAAVALALTGLGGAALSWMMGQISARAGSLKISLVVPLTAGVVLLALCIPSRWPGDSSR